MRYPWMKKPSSSAIWKTSAVYRMKNNGPRTEPWGTPNWTTVVEDVLPSADQVRAHPVEHRSSKSKRYLQSTEKDAVVHAIEGSTQIEHTEQSKFTHVSCDQGVWGYLQESGLCGMAASIPRNHSIIVLSHRLLREGGRGDGKHFRWDLDIRVLNFYDWAITSFCKSCYNFIVSKFYLWQ